MTTKERPTPKRGRKFLLNDAWFFYLSCFVSLSSTFFLSLSLSLSFFLSFYLSFFLSFYLSLFLSFYLSLSLFLSFCVLFPNRDEKKKESQIVVSWLLLLCCIQPSDRETDRVENPSERQGIERFFFFRKEEKLRSKRKTQKNN